MSSFVLTFAYELILLLLVGYYRLQVGHKLESFRVSSVHCNRILPFVIWHNAQNNQKHILNNANINMSI